MLLSKYALTTITLLLGGCALPTISQVIEPPEHLLVPCEQGTPVIVTNGDLARAYRLSRAELAECAARHAELRAWVQEAR